ncbi:MAG: vitamin K epoxide reductase family protein [Leptolyngbyaceae cyanobacterium SM1_1_3]|nr:vitamin K epoxide reductase family protein [Leptolyngbyaceae cyanobacterium SM1_1_3]NJM84894.1 vitamin K epoxide reductase family protein [Leptolyngbyaceae cyanobacterium RM2_2_21]NJN02202.1 vitamin K epoxide reductase family protein [Leptolyngbyaceae cyanobacterium RM1_1_2]NJO10354.1 vitamin K epoxide reductase family protein [Leptolyngbyaceae cyanobacterium SL_1_1]
MRRRRQEDRWIHRWARPLIATIAAIGATGTAYLTVVKLLGGEAACPTGGCDRVLSSPYAEIFGLPLTLFGFLAYASMAVLAIAPLVVNPETHKELRQKLHNWTRFLLFIGAVGMVVFSGYLMYLLAFEIKALCLYCLTSAAFTVLMLGLTLLGHRWEDVGQLMFTGLIVAVVALVGTLGVYAPIGGGGTAASAVGEAGPAVTTPSGEAEMALAQHLSTVGGKMYGAWWCPHCHDQKQLFGQEAAKEIPYVECDSQGVNPQTELCQATAQVEGFPTWEINGEFYSGTQNLEKLADASGYTGSRSFRN